MRAATRRGPSRHREDTEPALTRHILVATEGSDSVSFELAAARAIADRHGSKVEVLSVVVPDLPAPLVSDLGLIAPINPLVPSAPDLQARHRRIADELARAGRPEWGIAVIAGWPGEQIPRVAHDVGATLIVMGIGRHAPIDRLMGSETALQVIQQADVPVLATARDAAGLPRRALAAVDFTDQSEAGAEAAAQLVADNGTLHLAHIRTDWVDTADPNARVDLYGAGVERRFEELERRLAPRDIKRIVRLGDPPRELLRCAGELNADLIAVGAQTHGRLHRIFLGSVAAKLLRSAHCSVLVIPAHAERPRSEGAKRAAAERGAPRSRRRSART